MRRLPYIVLLLVACATLSLLPTSRVHAQGWLRLYARGTFGAPIDMLQFPNGDYLTADNPSYTFGQTNPILSRVSRLNASGDTIWTRIQGRDMPITDSYYIIDVAMDGSGGFVIVGNALDANSNPRATLKHLDGNGQVTWVRDLGSGLGESVIQTLDGGYVVGGLTYGTTLPDHYYIAKTDSVGNQLWNHVLPYRFYNFFYWTPRDETIRIVETPSQDLLVMAKGDTTAWGQGTFLLHADAQGVTQGEIRYWEPPYNHLFGMLDMCASPDGGLAMVGQDSNGVNMFILTDSLGTILQMNTDTAFMLGNKALSAICPLQSGGYFMAAGATCFRTDALGNIIWSRVVPTTFGFNPQVMEDDDQFLLLHYSYRDPFNVHPEGIGLAKYDSLGHIYTNLLRGNVYADRNLNCTIDAADVSLSNWVVSASPSSFYTTTDQYGNYELEVDTGTYTLQPFVPYYYQPYCPATGQIVTTLTAPFDTVSGLDFALEVPECPALEVEINTPWLRRCSTNVYAVTYDNLGMDTALNAIVQVIMDPWLTVTGASIPWVQPQVGDTFYFPVGDLPPFGNGSFTIDVNVSCDPNIIGMTHCVLAHIFPDTSCAVLDTLWDRASIAVEGTCITNDTVRFRITNQGTGAMSTPGGLVILEDDILMMAGTFDLDVAEDTIIDIVANGKTYALIAQQRPGHPGHSHPRAFVEACGTNAFGAFSTGHILTHAQDEVDYFIAIDCDENMGSYDPNDKQASPLGMGAAHLTAATDQLGYTIRFQNTGTDTAFQVIIRDRLDPHLDPLTFRPGSSSHPFTWRIHNQGEVEFRFDHILLPDSNVDEPASHGFVTYTIDQQPGNPDGTVIYNEADIYFDFNLPVRTNQTFNEIGSLPWSYLVYTIDAAEAAAPSVKVWPNPFTSTATIDLGERVYRNLEFELWDLNGRLMQRQSLHHTHEITLDGAGLQAGMYLFRVRADGKWITGKALLIDN